MKYIVTKKCYANEFVSVIAESEEEALLKAMDNDCKSLRQSPRIWRIPRQRCLGNRRITSTRRCHGSNTRRIQMTLKEAMNIVLAELKDRLPKTNLDGFMADKKVYEAMMILKEYHEEVGEFE